MITITNIIFTHFFLIPFSTLVNLALNPTDVLYETLSRGFKSAKRQVWENTAHQISPVPSGWVLRWGGMYELQSNEGRMELFV